mmetsp:Transcript_3068/g.5240  ORF Transcript_3068/g.5240 Transcript_3068/m.5240 type:complete len:275 (+) Transcript_3068:1073-1897(+)
MTRENVGGIADKGQHAFRTDLAPEFVVECLSHDRGAVDLEVARVDHPSGLGVDHQARGLGDGVRDGRERDLERPRLHDLWVGLDHAHLRRVMSRLVHLAHRVDGGELSAIDGGFQTVPEVAKRADVILVGVGDEDRLDPILACFQPFHVGQDQIHARLAVHIGEGHARVHDDQPLLPFRPIAVDITVHPDFPGAADGKVDEAVAISHVGFLSLLYLWITVRPCIVRSSSIWSNSTSPLENNGARPPVPITRISRSWVSRYSPRIRSQIPRTRPM